MSIGSASLGRFTANRCRVVEVDFDDESARLAAPLIADATKGTTLAAIAKIMSQRIVWITALPLRNRGRMLAVRERDAVSCSRLVTFPTHEAWIGRTDNISSAIAGPARYCRLNCVSAKKATLRLAELLALETVRDRIGIDAIMPGCVPTKTLLDRADVGIFDRKGSGGRRRRARRNGPDEIAHGTAFPAEADRGLSPVLGWRSMASQYRGTPNGTLSFPHHPRAETANRS